MKSIYIADLQLGQTFTAPFAVSCSVASSPKTSWLDVIVSDKTGTIKGKRWGARGSGAPSKGFDHPFAQITATVEEYPKDSGILQLNIAHLSPFDPEGDLGDFEVCAVLSLGALQEAVGELIGSVKHPHLRGVLDRIFGDDVFRDSFDVWPAAVGMHHAVKHGLLQHTFEVADAVAIFCRTHKSWGYAPLDRDLAVAGALLHDIGKVDEMGPVGAGYEFTLDGGFEGHILSGWLRVHNAISNVGNEDFPEILAHKLRHIIASHHGKKEFGSPVEPMIPEAEVVNLFDVISARLYMYAHPENKPPLGSSFAKSFGLGHRMFMEPVAKPSAPPPPRPKAPAGAAFEPLDESIGDITTTRRRAAPAPKPRQRPSRASAQAAPAPKPPIVNDTAFVPLERTLFDGGIRHNAAGEEDHFGG